MEDAAGFRVYLVRLSLVATKCSNHDTFPVLSLSLFFFFLPLRLRRGHGIPDPGCSAWNLGKNVGQQAPAASRIWPWSKRVHAGARHFRFAVNRSFHGFASSRTASTRLRKKPDLNGGKLDAKLSHPCARGLLKV